MLHNQKSEVTSAMAAAFKIVSSKIAEPDVTLPSIFAWVYVRLATVQMLSLGILALNIVGFVAYYGIIGRVRQADVPAGGIFFVTIVFSGCAVAAAALEKRKIRRTGIRNSRTHQGEALCRECRYDLDGLPLRSVVCPECGTVNTPARRPSE